MEKEGARKRRGEGKVTRRRWGQRKNLEREREERHREESTCLLGPSNLRNLPLPDALPSCVLRCAFLPFILSSQRAFHLLPFYLSTFLPFNPSTFTFTSTLTFAFAFCLYLYFLLLHAPCFFTFLLLPFAQACACARLPRYL